MSVVWSSGAESPAGHLAVRPQVKPLMGPACCSYAAVKTVNHADGVGRDRWAIIPVQECTGRCHLPGTFLYRGETEI